MTRARTWIGGGCLAAAAVLGAAAFGIASRSGEADRSASPGRATVLPSTIAPVEIPSPTVATPGPAATSAPAAGPSIDSTTTSTTTPLSPLGALIGDATSVVPMAVARPPAPTRVSIAAIGVDVPIRAVGVQPDGQLEIPDETEVGWYRLGASPGEAGASVLAGHVSWNRTTGPFFRLGQLEPGATVDIGLDDGTVRTYQVVERAQYPKQALPVERVWASDGPEVLVLITCGGAFNPDIHRYADNIVVYAVPVA